MSSLHGCNRSGFKRRATPPRVGKMRKLKKAHTSDTGALLPARYGPKFPPNAVMGHRVVLEIPSWTRRKLEKWLEKLRVEQGIESSVDLSTKDRADLPLLSRPIISAPGREFEMVLGSNPTSPQLVEDDSPSPQIGSPHVEQIECQSSVPMPSPSGHINSSCLSDLPLVLVISSSEDDS